MLLVHKHAAQTGVVGEKSDCLSLSFLTSFLSWAWESLRFLAASLSKARKLSLSFLMRWFQNRRNALYIGIINLITWATTGSTALVTLALRERHPRSYHKLSQELETPFLSLLKPLERSAASSEMEIKFRYFRNLGKSGIEFRNGIRILKYCSRTTSIFSINIESWDLRD